MNLRGTDTPLGEVTLSCCSCVSSVKGSTLKGKNLLPIGANSFFLKLIPFQKRIDILECKQEVTDVVSLLKCGGKSSRCIKSL